MEITSSMFGVLAQLKYLHSYRKLDSSTAGGDKGGGGNRGSAPPWACQGGALPPPEILASKKSEEDLEELCYFIHIILNPNDPLLKTFIDYRLISTYWEIVSIF